MSTFMLYIVFSVSQSNKRYVSIAINSIKYFLITVQPVQHLQVLQTSTDSEFESRGFVSNVWRDIDIDLLTKRLHGSNEDRDIVTY